MLALRGIIKKHKPPCVFLMETRGKQKRMENTARRLGFGHTFVVEPEGNARGLLLMWADDIELTIS